MTIELTETDDGDGRTTRQRAFLTFLFLPIIAYAVYTAGLSNDFMLGATAGVMLAGLLALYGDVL